MIHRLLRPYLFLLFVGLSFIPSARSGAESLFETVVIDTQGGPIRFDIEIARTDEDRQKGLMGRAYLPERRGMMFDFEQPQSVQMWMKNTPLSLDIVFIRADGTIARIVTGEPYSTRTLPSGEPVLAVLEINGGLSAKLGIKEGDVVRYKLFANRE